MPKVSIIVPIYNVEDYLSRSLDSLRRQTLDDIQIILVDDGSTDNSLELCYRFQRSDNRIIVINKPNGGVSSARNSGLRVATGQYVGFVDPDDWVEPNMYERLYSTITEANADVCMCNYVLEKGRYSTPVVLPLSTNLLSSEEDITEQLICNMLAGPTLNSGSTPIMGSVWRMLIKRELIAKKRLQFTEGIAFMEDLIFCIQTLLLSSKVCIDRGCYYHYVRREGSAAHTYKESSMYFDVYNILLRLLKDKLWKYPELQKRMGFRYVNMVLNLVSNEMHKDNRKDLVGKLSAIRHFCRDKRLRDILEDMDMTGYTLRKRLVLFSLKHGWSLFLFTYYGILNRVLRRLDLLDSLYSRRTIYLTTSLGR